MRCNRIFTFSFQGFEFSRKLYRVQEAEPPPVALDTFLLIPGVMEFKGSGLLVYDEHRIQKTGKQVVFVLDGQWCRRFFKIPGSDIFFDFRSVLLWRRFSCWC